MSRDKTGAIIVIEQSNSLEFIKSTGDKAKIELSPQIIESIFQKMVRCMMEQLLLRVIQLLLLELFFLFQTQLLFQKDTV